MSYIPGAWRVHNGIDPDAWDDELTIILRQSEVANATLCNGRVALPRRLGIELPPSEAMFFGTMMHEHIDYFITSYINHWPLDWVEDFERIEDFALTEAAAEIPDLRDRFTSSSAWRMWINEQMFMLNAWVEQWFLDNVHLVEEAVVREQIQYVHLGHVNVNDRKVEVLLRGTPDLATPRLLVDWKTSGKGWSKGKAYGSIQDDVYAGLLQANHGLEIRDAVFVVGDRSQRKWTEHPTRVTEASIEAAMFRAYTIAGMVALNTPTFTPITPFGQRSWHCRPQYCSAWDACPAKALGDEHDVQPQEVRDLWM